MERSDPQTCSKKSCKSITKPGVILLYIGRIAVIQVPNNMRKFQMISTITLIFSRLIGNLSNKIFLRKEMFKRILILLLIIQQPLLHSNHLSQ